MIKISLSEPQLDLYKAQLSFEEQKFTAEKEHIYNKISQENKILKEVITKAKKYINDNLTIQSILDGKINYCINDYSFDYEQLLLILEGGNNE